MKYPTYPISRYSVLLDDGIAHRYRCPNGRGASVVCHSLSYGGKKGLWELAVLDRNGDLDYSTEITSDVIGWMKPQQIVAIVQRIAELED